MRDRAIPPGFVLAGQVLPPAYQARAPLLPNLRELLGLVHRGVMLRGREQPAVVRMQIEFLERAFVCGVVPQNVVPMPFAFLLHPMLVAPNGQGLLAFRIGGLLVLHLFVLSPSGVVGRGLFGLFDRQPLAPLTHLPRRPMRTSVMGRRFDGLCEQLTVSRSS